MDKSKRELLKLIGMVSTGILMHREKSFANEIVQNDSTSVINNSPEIKNDIDDKLIIPAAIKEGSKIAITAPASPTSMWEIHETVKFYKNNKCEVIVGDTIKNQKNRNRYFSAPDADRATEFMKFVNDKSINAIVCGRGGYGSGRILSYLNFDEIRKNPKIIIGFSDITLLILAIYKISNLVTYHGPVASQRINQFTALNIKKTIFETITLSKFSIPSIIPIIDGEAQGKITGGNLTMICNSLGTPYEIDTKDKLLFIEDVSEQPYKVDRMLTHLLNAGKLQSASAILFNGFKNMNTRQSFYPNKSFTIREIIEQLIKPLNIPLAINFEFGHESNMITLPIGIEAKIDLKKRSFEFLEKSVI